MRNDSINTFSDFLTSFNGYRKIVKDEKKLHGAALLKLGYAMHTQWYVIHTILLHTSGVFRFGMKYTPLYAHYRTAGNFDGRKI